MDISKIPADAKYITCNYCKFFDPATNGCYLFTKYDQSWDENSSQYERFQDTSPTNWCSHFALTMVDVLSKDSQPLRKDGTPKVSFDNYPELRKQLRAEEEGAGAKHSSSSGGCYIATCVYGSYDCPQVWTLRRYRDNILATKISGRLFIRFYYTISPYIVKLFGHTKLFNAIFRKKLDRMVHNLQQQGIDDTPYDDSPL